MKDTRVSWLHNFSPDIPQAGIFMWTAYEVLIKRDTKRSYEIVYSGRLDRLTSIPASGRRIAGVLSDSDVVHVQYGSLLFLLTCILNVFYRRKIVVSLRGSDIFAGNKTKLSSRVHNSMAVTFTKLALRFADRVITVSEKMKEEVVRRGFPKAEITCLPSPLHASFLSHPLDATKETRKVFFSALNPRSPNKRYDLAQRAVEQLPETELFLATELGREVFIEELASSKVVLLTSVSEGWPNVVKESLALGVPFVTTDVSDLSAMAAASGGLCHVCEDTPEDLARALSLVLDNDLSLEQRRNLRSLVQPFTPEHYSDHVAAIYDTLNEQ